MKSSWMAILLLTTLSLPLFGENRQKIWLPNSPLISKVQLLLQESGQTGLPFASPYTEEEISKALSKLDPARLSSTGKALLQTLQTELKPRPLYQEPGIGAFQLQPEFSLEGWLVWGDDNRRLRYGENSQKPVVNLPLEFWVLDNFYFTGNFQAKNDPFYILDHNGNGSNLVIDLSALNFHFPTVGGFSLGGPHWNVEMMRSPLSWGKGQTGQLVFSPDAGPQDFISFSTFWERFKFTSLVVSQDVYKYDRNQVNPPWGYYTSSEVPPSGDFSKLKYLIAHRFDVLPWDYLRLTLSELYLIKADAFDFRFLNPFLLYHNWFQSLNANSDMTLEFDWVAGLGIDIYGMIYIDYLKTAFKDTLYKDPTPGSFAFQLGGQYQLPVETGYFTAGLEWVRTDPFFYLNNRVDMTTTRRIVSNYTGLHGEQPAAHLYDMPFGYKYGPDSQVYFGQVGFQAADGWKMNFGVQLLQKGNITLRTLHPLVEDPANPYYVAPPKSTDTSKYPLGSSDPQYQVDLKQYQTDLKAKQKEYLDLSTPTGPNPQQDLSLQTDLGVNGRMFGLPDDLTLDSSVTLIWTWNKNHVAGAAAFDIQTVLSLSYKLK